MMNDEKIFRAIFWIFTDCHVVRVIPVDLARSGQETLLACARRAFFAESSRQDLGRTRASSSRYSELRLEKWDSNFLYG